MMSESYRELAAALRERLAVIADRELYQRDSAAHLEKLKVVSKRITVLGDALPPPVDRQLQHFLENCSFEKALALIERV